MKFPSGMEDYIDTYGWHFSKKMCEWATGKMIGRDGKKIVPFTRESLDKLYDVYGIRPENNKAYDDVYIACMCRADFLGNSIKDEMSIVQYVCDVIDDPDGYDGLPFTRFYADCIGSGTPIIWENMI